MNYRQNLNNFVGYTNFKLIDLNKFEPTIEQIIYLEH
jgi:hypothetical protein